MSLDILNQLDNQIKQILETVELQQMEITELKEKNSHLQQTVEQANNQLRLAEEEGRRLKQEQQIWQERIQSLLSRINEIG